MHAVYPKYNSCNRIACSAVHTYYRVLQQPAFNAFVYADELAWIRQLLRVLPNRQRGLCELYFIYDYSYDEIARFQNLSPTTVKNHIGWSMIILRNYMTKPKAPV